MITVKFKPQFGNVTKPVRKEAHNRLGQLKSYGVRVAKEKLSVSGGTAREGAPGAYFYGEPLNKWVYASAPGEPPRKQTGDLQASITSKFAGYLEGIIYSNSPYANIEFGSRLVAARPYLRPTLWTLIVAAKHAFRNLV